MNVSFNDKEIAFIKESVESYSNEFDIYDDEQIEKRVQYENVIAKIRAEYKDSHLFSLIN